MILRFSALQNVALSACLLVRCVCFTIPNLDRSRFWEACYLYNRKEHPLYDAFQRYLFRLEVDISRHHFAHGTMDFCRQSLLHRLTFTPYEHDSKQSCLSALLQKAGRSLASQPSTLTPNHSKKRTAEAMPPHHLYDHILLLPASALAVSAASMTVNHAKVTLINQLFLRTLIIPGWQSPLRRLLANPIMYIYLAACAVGCLPATGMGGFRHHLVRCAQVSLLANIVVNAVQVVTLL